MPVPRPRLKDLPRNVWAVSLTSFYMDISSELVINPLPEDLRGTAYGTYNAILEILDFPASLIAGLLWSGAGKWAGFGPSAPFFFGGIMALIAVVMLNLWKPKKNSVPEPQD
jgi:hypothetical protein